MSIARHAWLLVGWITLAIPPAASPAEELRAPGPDRYDAEGRLTEHECLLDGRPVRVRLLYDADGNRVGRSVEEIGTNAIAHATAPVVFPQLLDHNTPSGYAQVAARWGDADGVRGYLHGRFPVAEFTLDPSETNIRYLVHDGTGSTRVCMDAGGAEQARTRQTMQLSYSAFGESIEILTRSPDELAWRAMEPGAAVDVRSPRPPDHLFAGERSDPVLGTLDLRSRDYQSGLGRFTTADRFEGTPDDPLTLHRYVYCRNSPLDRVDPGGDADYSLASVGTASAVAGTLGMADTWIRTGGRASGTQLAGGFVTGALIGAGGALVTPVFLAARTGGRLALLSFGGAAGLIGIGKAVEENNPQLAVYRALVLGLLSSLSASAAEEGNVRVYRVESDQNARVIVGEAGEVLISPTDKMLFLNFGQRSRAEQFLAQRRATTSPGLGIKSFEVPRDYLNELRESAVPESLAHCNPDRPLAVDINKAPDQLGLRPDQIMKLIHEIIQGTGQVEP